MGIEHARLLSRPPLLESYASVALLTMRARSAACTTVSLASACTLSGKIISKFGGGASPLPPSGGNSHPEMACRSASRCTCARVRCCSRSDRWCSGSNSPERSRSTIVCLLSRKAATTRFSALAIRSVAHHALSSRKRSLNSSSPPCVPNSMVLPMALDMNGGTKYDQLAAAAKSALLTRYPSELPKPDWKPPTIVMHTCGAVISAVADAVIPAAVKAAKRSGRAAATRLARTLARKFDRDLTGIRSLLYESSYASTVSGESPCHTLYYIF